MSLFKIEHKKIKNPEIGMAFTHPTLGNVKIIAIHPLGTIDVQNIYSDKCYRITGLPMLVRD